MEKKKLINQIRIMLKKRYILSAVVILGVLAIGIGTVQAVRLLTKAEKIQLKQEVAPKAERSIERIGIFAPGFELEREDAIVKYAKEYGDGNFQVINYKGYTLIVPPVKADKLDKIKEQIDAQVFAEERSTPTADIQTSQIAKIRDVFGATGSIEYNPAMGAYTDDQGFQYNFVDGKLVNKQVGANSVLHAKFEQAYPHFKPDTVRTSKISNEEARTVTDQVVAKLFASERADNLKSNVQFRDLGDARLGIVYGDKEAQFLVDQVTGDVIHYSKIK
jgi:hypothetical protein